MIITKEVTYRGKQIPIEKLKPNSHIEVKVQCPNCGSIRKTKYRRITQNGHEFCQACALKLKNEMPIEVGEKFGRWTVINNSKKTGFSECECECGTVRNVENSSLRSGISKSCGCISKEFNREQRIYLDIGSIYGRLTVIAHSDKSGYSNCLCECGNECAVSNNALKNGTTKSCGCLRSDSASERIKKLNKKNVLENHWNWKGGTSTERELAMSRRNYKDWRTSVFERDNFTCQKCGQWGRSLHAHHIHNYADHPELRLEPTNGITFCEECHRGFHRINGMKTNKEQLDDFLSSKTTAN